MKGVKALPTHNGPYMPAAAMQRQKSARPMQSGMIHALAIGAQFAIVGTGLAALVLLLYGICP